MVVSIRGHSSIDKMYKLLLNRVFVLLYAYIGNILLKNRHYHDEVIGTTY